MNSPAKIQVLFCDSTLLVVNKPAGLRTLPDGYNPSLPHVKSLLEREYGRLWIVHRLDKETSGVLLLARSAQAHRSLNTQFEQHQVRKVYHALVMGFPGWQARTVNLPLRPNGDRHHRTVIDPERGKPAVTHLKVLEQLGDYCLLEAIPETGRTHQIRAHLSALDLFIVGDGLYGRKMSAHLPEKSSRPSPKAISSPILLASMALHARSLEISHPISGERMEFEAPYPPDWVSVLAQLRKLTSVENGP